MSEYDNDYQNVSYETMVANDIREWLEENEEWMEWGDTLETLPATLEERLWDEDLVTGNGGAGRFIWAMDARECCLDHWGEVLAALRDMDITPEEIGREILDDNWAWFDTMARLNALWPACRSIASELYAEGLVASEDDEEEKEGA